MIKSRTARSNPPKCGLSCLKQPTLPADLSEGERAIFGLLSADEHVHIDALVGASDLAVSELTGVLLGLEMRGLVRQLPGKRFVRKLWRQAG